MSADDLAFETRVMRRYEKQGFMPAGSLGELQTGQFERPRDRHVCKKHHYRRGQWFMRCEVCGHIEDYPKAPRFRQPEAAGLVLTAATEAMAGA